MIGGWPGLRGSREVHLNVSCDFIETIIMNFFIQRYCLSCCLRLHIFARVGS